MLLRCALVVSSVLAVADGVPPDSWMPFADQRVVSASGRRYVVIREAKKGITYELCERAPGAPAMTAAKKAFGNDAARIDRDPADRLVHAGTVAHLPVGVVVPDALDGFLLFETYYTVGRAKSATYVDGTGAERFSLTLPQIFGQVPAAATHSVSSTWWNQGYWIDEVAATVVVVAYGDELREIAIADGSVTTPDVSRLLDWCTTGATDSRCLALEVLGRLPAPDRKRAVFHDAAAAIALRLRAAVVLSLAGTPVAADALFAAARATDQPDAVRRYAVRQLPTVLGDKAIPVLRDLMRGKATSVWGDCYHAFAELGERAVPTLVAMVGEQGETPDYRGGAAHALGQIRSPAALDALLEATASADDYVANAAVNAAIATGGETLTERLVTILAEGSTQDGRITRHLAADVGAEAVRAIDAALARATDSDVRRRLQDARAACAR
jgi:HEAT repeat protein